MHGNIINEKALDNKIEDVIDGHLWGRECQECLKETVMEWFEEFLKEKFGSAVLDHLEGIKQSEANG